VWKAYGKFNLSAPSRNQNIAELRNYFSRIGAALQRNCACALRVLLSRVCARRMHRLRRRDIAAGVVHREAVQPQGDPKARQHSGSVPCC
jgi:hypothetical protein